MFLEFCGKTAYSRISPLFFYAFLLLPILGTGAYLFLQYSDLQELEEQCAITMQKEEGAFQKKNRAERFANRYANADPYFLNRHIESLSFLEKEQEDLLLRLNHPAMTKKQTLQERLHFLQNSNHLLFTESCVRSSSKIKETEEKQRKSVQMNETDIARLCAIVEDIPIKSFVPIPNMPQLLFLDFRMKKIKTPLYSNVYEVETELLKREWVRQ